MSDARTEKTTTSTTTTTTEPAPTRIVEVEEGSVDTRTTPVVDERDIDLVDGRTAAEGEVVEDRPRRGGGKGWIIALVILALLAAGLVFADRYTKSWAEKKSAAQMQTNMGTPEQPKITIHDTPFLTSAAANKFNHVTMSADKLNTQTPIEHLDADLRGLKMSNNYQNAVATDITGKARVTWETIAKQAGYDLKYSGDNKVTVNYNFEFFGQKLNAVVVGTPRLDVDKQVVMFDNPGVNVAGITLPADATKQIMNTFVKPIQLPLPGGIKATGMTLADNGAIVDFEGHEVDLNKLK